jgi:hypothetical protein
MDQIVQVPEELARETRRVLLAIARHEDELANREAAKVPYWAPTPVSVQGHRAAAEALRADADLFAWAC